VGAQGIDYTDGENILIADTPEQFAHQIKRCLEDDAFCNRIGEAAARLVADQYDRKKLAEELIEFYDKRLEI
jgi:glycosyltransferase involved in cell wall biosynthesis